MDFQDTLSVINLHNGYQMGKNPVIHTTADLCNESWIANNHLQTYVNNVYIQDTTFSQNASVSGYTIYAGEQVTLQKDEGIVVVRPGKHVIMDAEAGVHLKEGVEVKLGATLEVR